MGIVTLLRFGRDLMIQWALSERVFVYMGREAPLIKKVRSRLRSEPPTSSADASFQWLSFGGFAMSNRIDSCLVDRLTAVSNI